MHVKFHIIYKHNQFQRSPTKIGAVSVKKKKKKGRCAQPIHGIRYLHFSPFLL